MEINDDATVVVVIEGGLPQGVFLHPNGTELNAMFIDYDDDVTEEMTDPDHEDYDEWVEMVPQPDGSAHPAYVFTGKTDTLNKTIADWVPGIVAAREVS